MAGAIVPFRRCTMPTSAARPSETYEKTAMVSIWKKSGHHLPFLCAALELCLCLSVSSAQAQPTPLLKRAHAHNDYLHPRPLLDALEQGFGSVEADIFLVGEELQVAHTRSELSPERTLRALYLEPLKQRMTEHHGSVYGDGESFTLLIDIKTEGEATFQALHRLLLNYRELLSRQEEGKQWQSAAVTVIVSGNRSLEAIAQSSPRLVGIDGRLSDIDSSQAVDLLPLISDNWGNHFSWRGVGQFPEIEREKLRDIVGKIHAQQRRVRFWATPDNPAMWLKLQQAGVDMINTDNLAGLSEFLKNSQL